jgi:hypothetical protein
MREAVFDPNDIAKLVIAYQAALEGLYDGDYDHIPSALLRRTIARQILFETRKGNLDPQRLAEAALRALRRPLLLSA